MRLESLWRHILQTGAHYGVNPLLFAALYLAHHPLFWGTMAWLALRVRRQRPVGGVIALAVFFWLLPYLYVFAFGRHLPLWVYALVAVVLVVGGLHAAREIRRRLKPEFQADKRPPRPNSGEPEGEKPPP